MAEIILANNKGAAICDDCNFEELSKHRWWISSKGYAVRHVYLGGKKSNVRMHREILRPPHGLFVDHVDRNKLNNTRINLRIVTTQENQWNIGKRTGTKSSIYKGVRYHKDNKKFVADITHAGKRIHLGGFLMELDAALAYNEAAKRLFGEFAFLNNVNELDGAKDEQG